MSQNGLIAIVSLSRPCCEALHGRLSGELLTRPALWVFKLQMNHSRTIRTASRCIDDCCVKQTSGGKEKNRIYTTPGISLSVGDIQLLMVWADSNVLLPWAVCVRLRKPWTLNFTSPQKLQKWMQENVIRVFLNFLFTCQSKENKWQTAEVVRKRSDRHSHKSVTSQYFNRQMDAHKNIRRNVICE